MSETVVDEIQAWVAERIAYYLSVPVSDLDPDGRLVDMGMDSIYSLTLCGDIEDRFDCEVAETVAWDHPTINLLAAHLRDELKVGR